MEGGSCLAVGDKVARERAERRTAERVVRTPFCGRLKPGDDLAVEAERRQPVADALLGIGQEFPKRPPQSLERRASVATNCREILIDCRRLLRHGHTRPEGALESSSTM